MKIEQTQAKTGSKNRLAGAVMGLAFVAGAFLSMGSAPTKPATSSIEATERVSSTPDSISPGEAIAERDTLDLQLD